MAPVSSGPTLEGCPPDRLVLLNNSLGEDFRHELGLPRNLQNFLGSLRGSWARSGSGVNATAPGAPEG